MDYLTIYGSLKATFTGMWAMFLLYVPKIFTALALLIIGYIVAKVISKIVYKALDKLELNKLGQKVGLADLLVSLKLSPNLSALISKILFIFIFLVFIIATADALNLETLSKNIDKFMLYIPNIIGAIFIFFLTAITGHFLKQTIQKTGESLRLDFAPALGNLIYYGILLIGVILAIGQLKIETEFLTRVLEILLISTGASIAISLGLGSRDVSKNILSGVYLKDSLVEGATVKVGNFEGVLISIKPVCFELEELQTKRKIILPNSRLLECEILQQDNS